ncbi:MAG: gluconate 2-dehydrogenase gamma chain [Rhodothermales bacterium]|jgi:gluconate 2-dehydrogenase gamma chain
MDRREYLKLLGVASVGVALPGCSPAETGEQGAAGASLTRVAKLGDPPGDFSGYTPRFFSESEMNTLRVLVDIIIPADEHSGSATDARVPEFIDFTAWEHESFRVRLRGGMAWLDIACQKTFASPFAECSEQNRIAMVDRIAWPDVAAEEDSAGVAFFSLARDMTMSGFYSSKLGVQDLGYMGNTAIPVWTGCTEV